MDFTAVLMLKCDYTGVDLLIKKAQTESDGCYEKESNRLFPGALAHKAERSVPRSATEWSTAA